MIPTYEAAEVLLAPHLHLLAVSALLLFVLALAEVAVNQLWTPAYRRPLRQSLSNLVVGLGQAAIGQVLEKSITVAALMWFAALAPAPLAITWWSWPLAFVVGDFFYYWTHRFEHRVRLGWAHHSVHHSDVGFDLSTAQRIAWTEPLVSWYGLVPSVLLGFHPAQVLIVSQLLLLYQFWIHTSRLGRLPWIEGLFNTPSAHRVHHAANADYLDANYAAVFIVWDRLFGTYLEERPEEPVRYGLTTPVTTLNPVAINLHEYAVIARGVLRARSLTDALLWLVGPPDWSPEHGFRKLRPSSSWTRLVSLVEARS